MRFDFRNVLIAFTMFCVGGLRGQTGDSSPAPAADTAPPQSVTDAAYILGSDDEISLWALGMEEFVDKVFRVDSRGYVDVPLLGPIRAEGRTLQELRAELAVKLTDYVREPQVFVKIVEFRSQPVSVIGAVNTPGLHYLRGHKTLVEVLSLAGGVRHDASYRIQITRRKERGTIPVASAKEDATGRFTTAEIALPNVLDGRRPEENIVINADDVIAVPRAQMIYVVGEVRKPGGFLLHDRESLSVLQALSLAEGLDRTASPKQARILRQNAGAAQRMEIPVDLRKIFRGDASDVPMRPDDILFVPNSAAKSASMRAIEASIQVATGVVIWRR